MCAGTAFASEEFVYMRLTAILGSSALVVASLVAFVAACADGAQEPRFPDAQPAAPVETGDTTRVPQRPSNADVRAELEAAQRKDVSSAVAHGDAGADAGASANAGDDANANANVNGADGGAPAPVDGDVDVERREFESKARDRLTRIDARARELKEKGARLTASKKTSFEATLRRVTTDRSDVEAKLRALSRSASWKASKASVERGLDDLESTLAKLDDQI